MQGTVFQIPHIVQRVEVSFFSCQGRMGFRIGQKDVPTQESEHEAGDTETQTELEFSQGGYSRAVQK